MRQEFQNEFRGVVMKCFSFSRVVIASAIAVLGFCFSAQAVEKPENYPKRPVTVIVPFGAGGGADQMARAFLPEVSKVIGVPIIIVKDRKSVV